MPLFLYLFLYPIITFWHVGTTLILICCLLLLLSYDLPKQLQPLMLPWQPLSVPPVLLVWCSRPFPTLTYSLFPVIPSIISPFLCLVPDFLCGPLPMSQLLKVLWWIHRQTLFFPTTFFHSVLPKVLNIKWSMWFL